MLLKNIELAICNSHKVIVLHTVLQSTGPTKYGSYKVRVLQSKVLQRTVGGVISESYKVQSRKSHRLIVRTVVT